MQIASLKDGNLALVHGEMIVPVGAALVERGILRESSMIELIARWPEIQGAVEAVAAEVPGKMLDQNLLGPPVARPSKLWAAAGNYRRGTAAAGGGAGRGEASELSPAALAESAFLKPSSAIIGPGEAIRIPPGAENIFPELELCAVIGRRVSNIAEAEALDAVFGYTVTLDVTARQFGSHPSLVATRCVRKGFDTFAPLGPWIVTRDEVPDPQNLALRLAVNEEIVQDASTNGMINSVAALVSFLSRVSTLEPGDLIATGNPDAPEFQRRLQPGDILDAGIENIGVLRVGVTAG